MGSTSPSVRAVSFFVAVAATLTVSLGSFGCSSGSSSSDGTNGSANTDDGTTTTRDASSGDAGPATCSELTRTAETDLAPAYAAADESCKTDSDCELFTNSTDCSDGCGFVVSTAGAAALQTAIDKENAGTCASFVAQKCEVLALPCAFAGKPTCVANKCTGAL